MDDLNDVLAFARVAELGSFTAAARRLGLPKSSVSARVARLEAHLGATLIERNTRTLRLTDVGARYQEHARRVVLELDVAAASVEQFQARPSGLLRISAPTGLGQALLPGVVTLYTQRHAEVRVFVELTNRRVDLLEEGVDIALRGGELADSSLVARRLGRSAARLFAAPAYLQQHGVPPTPAALEQHTLLECGAAPGAGLWQLRHDDGGPAVTVDRPFRLVSSDMATLLHAAGTGLGIVNLPEFGADAAVAAGTLVPVLAPWSTRQMAVHAVFPAHKRLSPALRAFVDLCVEQLAPRLQGRAAA